MSRLWGPLTWIVLHSQVGRYWFHIQRQEARERTPWPATLSVPLCLPWGPTSRLRYLGFTLKGTKKHNLLPRGDFLGFNKPPAFPSPILVRPPFCRSAVLLF